MRISTRVLSAMTATAFVLGGTVGIAGMTVGAALKGSAIFPDVPFGAYYDDAVGEMYDEGIITGYDDGTFKPEDPVTRGQVALMMQRFMNNINGGGSSHTTSSSSRSSTSSSSSSTSSSSSSSSDDGILNDHGAFRFAVSAFSISESSATATVSVLRTEGDEGAVKVNFATSDGTAKAGEDFTANSGTLSFADGESTKTISVTLKNDSVGESAESFTIKLSNPTGDAEVGSPDTITITINDNDSSSGSSSSSGNSGATSENGVFGFSASSFAVSENASSVTIYVARTGGTKGAVTVNYATSNGTANSSHYTSANGTLSFADGESEKSFTVAVANNSEIDGSRTVNLTLSSPTGGAVLGTTSTSLSILDDEILASGTGTLKVIDDEFDMLEGENLDVTISRVGGATGTITVKFETIDGTAKSATDYTATSGTLTFRPGETGKKIRVSAKTDTSNEDAETLRLRIFEPKGTTIGTPSEAVITIY